MGAFSTNKITREQAEDMVRQCRLIKNSDIKSLSDQELFDELNDYCYEGNHEYNSIIDFHISYKIDYPHS